VIKKDKWLLLTTAPDQLTAEIWKDILLQEGIPAVVNPEDAVSFLGVSAFPCRIMVAPGYLKQAQEILASLQAEEEANDKG
jgi:Putative prokaryotic signal transducing protein